MIRNPFYSFPTYETNLIPLPTAHFFFIPHKIVYQLISNMLLSKLEAHTAHVKERNVILIFMFYLFLDKFNFLQAAAAKGEAPPGLPLKGAGQDSSDAQPTVIFHENKKKYLMEMFDHLVTFTLLNRLMVVLLRPAMRCLVNFGR